MTKEKRKAHAKYMREWRRKRKELVRIVREDLADLYVDLDLRKKLFLKKLGGIPR